MLFEFAGSFWDQFKFWLFFHLFALHFVNLLKVENLFLLTQNSRAKLNDLFFCNFVWIWRVGEPVYSAVLTDSHQLVCWQCCFLVVCLFLSSWIAFEVIQWRWLTDDGLKFEWFLMKREWMNFDEQLMTFSTAHMHPTKRTPGPPLSRGRELKKNHGIHAVKSNNFGFMKFFRGFESVPPPGGGMLDELDRRFWKFFSSS